MDLIESTEPQPFRFEDERQRRIYQRLGLIGPGPASLFRDACKLMASPSSFQSTTHIVGHLMREIDGAVRDVLRPQVPASGDDQAEKYHGDDIKDILNLLGIPNDHVVSQLWLDRRVGRGLHRLAHRGTLIAVRSVDDDFLDTWNSVLTVWDLVLEKFREIYLEFHKVLDELLEIKVPTNDDRKRLRTATPNNLVSLGYFFDRLKSVDWLDPLARDGYFQHPPPPETGENGVRFISWPQARYLARIAPCAPESVVKIILEMSITDNISVLTDLAKAACTMPAEQAVRLTDRAKTWISGPHAGFMLLPDQIGRFVDHLADGGYLKEALDLARSALALRRS